MNIAITTIQLVVALGIFNVWILRCNKETIYRAGTAKNIKEEFAAYGLPFWFMVAIGSLKVSLATVLIIGVWVPVLTKPAAGILAILMLGAIAMHVKVKDPALKAVPAISLFLLSSIVALLG